MTVTPVPIGDICVEGGCVSGDPVICADDGDACTIEYCNSSTGECGSYPLNCDDLDPCTNDSCDPASGCQYTSNPGAVCDDGFQCTSEDICRNAIPALGVLPCETSAQCSLLGLGPGGTCGPSGFCTCTLDTECEDDFVCRFGACVRTV